MANELYLQLKSHFHFIRNLKLMRFSWALTLTLHHKQIFSGKQKYLLGGFVGQELTLEEKPASEKL